MLGVGVDIVRIDRLSDIEDDALEPFRVGVFTEGERARAAASPHTMAHYAMVFAAKEAVFKCFGTTWDTGVEIFEIEVVHGPHGEPRIQLHGRFAELAEERGLTEVLISMSYDTDYAVATAALVGGPSDLHRL